MEIKLKKLDNLIIKNMGLNINMFNKLEKREF